MKHFEAFMAKMKRKKERAVTLYAMIRAFLFETNREENGSKEADVPNTLQQPPPDESQQATKSGNQSLTQNTDEADSKEEKSQKINARIVYSSDEQDPDKFTTIYASVDSPLDDENGEASLLPEIHSVAPGPLVLTKADEDLIVKMIKGVGDSNANSFEVNLHLADMSYSFFHNCVLNLERYPFETDKQIMVRILVYALHVDTNNPIHFRKKLRIANTPDMWQEDGYGSGIEVWIDFGLIDNERIKYASDRSAIVYIYLYENPEECKSWWETNRELINDLGNVVVIDISAPPTESIGSMVTGKMFLQCTLWGRRVMLFDSRRCFQIEVNSLTRDPRFDYEEDEDLYGGNGDSVDDEDDY